ncbi:MAG TPA: PTS sugar transporter subunit IIA [Planctomycetota bacterium]|nr:PTS sugar transporter subunit IIA [Planctomycetota bacterium]
MKLSDLLKEDVIFTDFQARDQWHALEDLVRSLVTLGRLRPDQEKGIRDALIAREKVSTTGLGMGIAIPHAMLDGLDDVIAGLAIAPDGVPFDAADGQAARIIFLLLVPRKTVQIHIRALFGITRLVHSDEMRRALRHARIPREVLDIIREEEAVGT